MKVSYRPAATDDVARQFRYYLVTLDVPEVAERFRDAVRLRFRRCGSILFLVSTIVYGIRNFKISASGRLPDSKRCVFTISASTMRSS